MCLEGRIVDNSDVCWMQWGRGSILILVTLAMAGCAFGGPPVAPGVTLSTVPLPDDREATGVAWLERGLVATLKPKNDVTMLTSRLWRLQPDGSEAAELPLPAHPGCTGQSFVYPSRLPDGRLGYLVDCLSTSHTAPLQVYLMAYDLGTGQAEDLLPYPLKTTPARGGYAWNPAMTRGITDDGIGLREQLFWFTRAGKEPLDLGMARAYGVAWSPDGQQIAFLGARPQGLSGIAAADATFTLYLMQPDGTGLQPLVEGIQYGGATAWSPDGRWLVFPGKLEAHSQRGQSLWLAEVATGQIMWLASGSYGHPAWSPDSTRIAAIEWGDVLWNRPSQLVIVTPPLPPS
jgi:hypothetical protein